MNHILAEAHRHRLARLSRARVLLAFDFDGTLAPIVERPEDAFMRPRTRALLASLCERYPCAIITGRSCADVRPRLAGTRPEYIIGNHGLEPGERLEDFARHMLRVRAQLAAAVVNVPGVEIEDKRYSFAVHYRHSRSKQRVRALLQRALVPTGARILGGKLVINVLPPDAPHKGQALLGAREAAGAQIALYVGDDRTDEDVFRLDQPDRVLGVRVGRAQSSAAPYFLRDQREMDRLLSLLADLRQP